MHLRKGQKEKKTEKRTITQTPAKAKLPELLSPLDYQKLYYFSFIETKRK